MRNVFRDGGGGWAGRGFMVYVLWSMFFIDWEESVGFGNFEMVMLVLHDGMGEGDR